MIHILGIRHHGPGSAKNVKHFLEQVQPDIVLVEGPPEADALLQWVNHKELKPPVAILAYQTDDIKKSVFYPFAEFSPEWNAIQYALSKNIHVRFMDLPLVHSFAIEQEEKEKQKEKDDKQAPTEISNYALQNNTDASENNIIEIKRNPIGYLSEAAGFEDDEKWWEHTFENRVNNDEIFIAVQEAMQALRESIPAKEDRIELLREAYMRKIIRQAAKEMFQNIAVICGAWHAPVLTNMPKQKEDNDLLKNLPKVKVECTWIPWTYSRLSFYSGYGAGINSPGWYEHLWHYPNDDGTRWMARVAKLFRENEMDTSVAHVIEAVRLAESLASLRGLPKAGLEELNEATLSVLCNGETILLQLIDDQLIVSNKIGEVPLEIPKPPLQLDIEKLQKKLRLPPGADWKDYTLDLRKENDLERSVFLHRLSLLGISWGNNYEAGGKGTFKEQWRLQWDPSFVINIIEKGVWGNTLQEACNAWLINQCNQEKSLQNITELLQKVIPADLTDAAAVIAHRIDNMAAATNDVIQLVKVLPGLVNVMRYGNVRKTDAEMVGRIAESMITRICIGLPSACCGISEEIAEALTVDCNSISQSIKILNDKNYLDQWYICLRKITDLANAASMMRGFSLRQLMDAGEIAGEPLYQMFYSSVSKALPVASTAAWLEGFLKGSGTVLLIDDELWQMVNSWVVQLDEELFVQALPLLRRTFSTFTHPERRKIGEKVKQGAGKKITGSENVSNFDTERAKRGIPIVMELFGYGKA